MRTIMNQEILSKMTKAIKQFNLIEDGDTVAVGVSGGKDSLLLLSALAQFRRFGIVNFNLYAITVDFGRKDMDFSRVAELCNSLDVPYFQEDSSIYDVVFNIRKEKNPCSLCAKMRRGALCSAAIKHGANKIALGHHSDDLIETFMLSLLYEGRLSTFAPKSLMTRTNVTVIRPFVYVDEKEIIAESHDLPVVFNPCPANKHTKRQEVKNLIETLKQTNPIFKDNIFGALTNPNRNNLWQDD